MKAKQNLISRKMLPEILNELEDEDNKFGLELVEVTKKPKLIAPGVRQMSLRMQSRCESRETENEKKDEEKLSERAASKQSSRSPSQQSPRGPSRSVLRKSE